MNLSEFAFASTWDPRILPSTAAGSPDNKDGHPGDEGSPHQVPLTKLFYPGKSIVIQAQWQAVMGSNLILLQGK